MWVVTQYENLLQVTHGSRWLAGSGYRKVNTPAQFRRQKNRLCTLICAFSLCYIHLLELMPWKSMDQCEVFALFSLSDRCQESTSNSRWITELTSALPVQKLIYGRGWQFSALVNPLVLTVHGCMHNLYFFNMHNHDRPCKWCRYFIIPAEKSCTLGVMLQSCFNPGRHKIKGSFFSPFHLSPALFHRLSSNPHKK